MRIGLLGGTGEMGRGLAVRWALNHEVLVGSRSLDKAVETAKELNNLARGFYQEAMHGHIRGVLNADSIKDSEVVVVVLPPQATVPYLTEIKDYFTSEQVVMSAVVPVERKGKLFSLVSLDAHEAGHRSAAEIIQEMVKVSPVVSAFHTVPAAYLSNIDAVLNVDVFIAGDDDLALAIVSKLIREIPNLRPLRVGPLENSRWAEALTPLLLNASILNGIHDPTLRIVPWTPT